MRLLSTPHFAIYTSLGGHALVLLVMLWQGASFLDRVKFAGERNAVTLSATFAPPVPLTEPQPVELVQSEMHADESVIDRVADAVVARQALEIKPTRKEAELRVEQEAQTPQAKLDQRREFKYQPKEITPVERPIPKRTKPIKMATLASAVPIPVGTLRETPPDFSMNPPPIYPLEAARNHWQGEVFLRLIVASDGQVSEVEIVRSSGYDILDEAAVEAVERWRGTPATQGGKPVSVVKYLPVRFSPKR
ncbi:TonB family protein [bacterium]|nr:TonB family protein [bacterium]